MSLELYSAARPGHPARAWALSASLLALACGLSAWQAHARVGRVLGEVLAPPDWKVSFRAPGGFYQEGLRAADGSSVVTYRMNLAPIGVAEITVGRYAFPDLPPPSEVCDRLISAHLPFVARVFSPPPPKQKEALGPWEGLEALHPAVPMVVRAASPPSGETYAVTLRVVDAALDDRLYRVFDSVCASLAPISGELRPTPSP